MTNKTLIHYFLLTVLCVSQFAATVHLAGHIHAPAHAHHHENDSGHFAGHHVKNLSIEAVSSEEIASECAIYHTYLGLSGWIPTYCNGVVANLKSASLLTTYTQIVVVPQIESHSIRGPPRSS